MHEAPSNLHFPEHMNRSLYLLKEALHDKADCKTTAENGTYVVTIDSDTLLVSTIHEIIARLPQIEVSYEYIEETSEIIIKPKKLNQN